MIKYCIIGTGFAGTCALWHLVRRLTEAEPRPTTIVTVEQSAVNGPGYPYMPTNVLPSHRCNNQACTMAIHDNDFVDWMTESKAYLVAAHPELVLETHPGIALAAWQPDADEFYPRALFGHYLEQRFREAVERARAHGIAVHHYVRHEVVDGYPHGDHFAVRLRDLANPCEFTLTGFDRVLLSTGHWQSAPAASEAGYLASPYPPQTVKAAVAALCPRRVFVQGMGPSAIDAIMTLSDDGEFVYTPTGHVASYRPAAGTPHIVVGARCGFFPLVRGPLINYELRHLTEDRVATLRHAGQLHIDRILELLELELREATGGALGWQDVASPRAPSAGAKLAGDLAEAATGNLIYTVVLKARRLRFYSHLAPRDKERYDRTLDTHFIRTAVPMPAANAEKLLALIAAGVLTPITLGYETPPPRAEAGGFVVPHRDGELRVDCMIRAAGQDFAIERHPSLLMRNLARRGEVVAHQEAGYATGGIALDGTGYRVMKQVNGVAMPHPQLTSFGSPVRFWQNERNFARAFVEAAEWVAGEWAEHANTTARRRAG